MKNQLPRHHDHRRRTKTRGGFTLVELLVVIFIISMLTALLTPAIQMARESARKAQCQSNLRQFGVGMFSRSERFSMLCSGAMDWDRDGSVMDHGWVADLIQEHIPVGEMLCTSNPFRMTEAYSDLLTLNSFTTCVDMPGSARLTLPDGKLAINPCRAIVESVSNPGTFPPPANLSFVPSSGTTNYNAGTQDRRELIEKLVYLEHYNTNYTASWFLVRSSLRMDNDGNLTEAEPGCGKGITLKNSTKGPLQTSVIDAAQMPASFIPLMGDGGIGFDTLPQMIGDQLPGTNLVMAHTPGPVLNPTMSTPAAFPAGTPQSTWWPVWARQTRQDYRSFAPVHAGYCNILFADGSVRAFEDKNRDGLLNNGFAPNPANGFMDDKLELPLEKVESLYSLLDSAAHTK